MLTHLSLYHNTLSSPGNWVKIKESKLQSNLDYSKCQGPQESFRIIRSSNDRNREFSVIFGKARMLSENIIILS